jgi:hypothetical protein
MKKSVFSGGGFGFWNERGTETDKGEGRCRPGPSPKFAKKKKK